MIKKNLYNKAWYWFCRYVSIIIPTPIFYRLVFFVNCKRLGFNWYWFNIKSPETFNEKINYLKLHDRNPLSPLVADKVRVREYVADTIGEAYLVPLINIYEKISDLDFGALPRQFALKTNHGSGWNLICYDKNEVDWPREKRKLSKWLHQSAYYLNREWQYRDTKPQLICEQLLEYEIKDYKFFCSNGRPQFIQVDMDRYTDMGHKRTLLTVGWDEIDVRLNYPRSEVTPEKPLYLEKMLAIARKLSKPFGFCRIDLYEHGSSIYFGEITIYPGGGVEPFLSKKEDLKMGKFIDLGFLNNGKSKVRS